MAAVVEIHLDVRAQGCLCRNPPKATCEDALDFCQHGFAEGCDVSGMCASKGLSLDMAAVVEIHASEPRDVFVVILRKQLVKMLLISASMDLLRAVTSLACVQVRVVRLTWRQLWRFILTSEPRDVFVVILRKQLVKMLLISASMDLLRAVTSLACVQVRVESFICVGHGGSCGDSS